MWFGIFPQFASHTLPWCLLYVLFPCVLTSPHRTNNAMMETERKCTSGQDTRWTKSLQIKMGNTVTWNTTQWWMQEVNRLTFTTSFLQKCFISAVLSSSLLGRFISHPVIWHNAENTLFTLEVFPPTAGSNPRDVKPLVQKNLLLLPISYCIIHSFVVNRSVYIILEKPKKWSCSQ